MAITVSNPVKLNFYQGDSVDFEVILKDDADAPIDLTGSSIESIIKSELTSTTEYPFTIVNTDLSNGAFNLTMTSAQSQALPITGSKARKSFVFDVNIVHASGQSETPLYGDIVVDRNRT